MSVYHCLVLTRLGAVPQLRSLSCDTAEDVPAAVAEVLREWAEVVGVEVFNDGRAVAAYEGEDLKALRSRP